VPQTYQTDGRDRAVGCPSPWLHSTGIVVLSSPSSTSLMGSDDRVVRVIGVCSAGGYSRPVVRRVELVTLRAGWGDVRGCAVPTRSAALSGEWNNHDDPDESGPMPCDHGIEVCQRWDQGITISSVVCRRSIRRSAVPGFGFLPRRPRACCGHAGPDRAASTG
jgi:hypothetical protein